MPILQVGYGVKRKRQYDNGRQKQRNRRPGIASSQTAHGFGAEKKAQPVFVAGRERSRVTCPDRGIGSISMMEGPRTCLPIGLKLPDIASKGPSIAVETERSIALLQHDAEWCRVVYTGNVATNEKSMRQSVSLPAPIAKRVKTLAKNQKTSTNRVLVELIETGLESKEAEKRRFFALADRLSISTDEKERESIKKELAKL